jgi:hypothetical protein
MEPAAPVRSGINLPLPVDGTHDAAAMLPITQFFAMRMKRRGVEMRLIIRGADAPPRKPDAALLKAIARAHRWFEELISARATSEAAQLVSARSENPTTLPSRSSANRDEFEFIR